MTLKIADLANEGKSGESSRALAAQADGDSLKVEQAAPRSSRKWQVAVGLDLIQPAKLLMQGPG